MDDGTLLSCQRQIYEDLDADDPARNKRAIRAALGHVISIESKVDRIIEEHTVDGEPIDIRSSYQLLRELVKEQKLTNRKLIFAQAGIWVGGLLGSTIVTLSIYIGAQAIEGLRGMVAGAEAQIKVNATVNAEQNVILGRLLERTEKFGSHPERSSFK